MTKITRETVRETDSEDNGRKLIVHLFPKRMMIGPKGTRDPVFVSYEAVYELARRSAARRK